MKIIDLLNKIAKGEEVPKKIRVFGEIYEYSDNDKFYYQNDYSMYRDFYTEGNCLNDEVEIIEEEKEIEKLEDYFRGEIWTNDIGQKRLDNNFDTFASKINQLIDVINDMRDKE